MKKGICLVLSVVLLLGVLTGCTGKTEGVQQDTAVSPVLMEAMGQTNEEVIELLGLKEENWVERQHGYTTELIWCDLPMETLVYMDSNFTGRSGIATAKAIMEDNEDIDQYILKCFAMLDEQFDKPYRYREREEYDLLTGASDGAESNSDQFPDMDTFLAEFAELDEGGMGFRYSLNENKEAGGGARPFLDCLFMRDKEQPGKVVVEFMIFYPKEILDEISAKDQ